MDCNCPHDGTNNNVKRKEKFEMETSFETEMKNKTANTWAGFWFFIFIISLIVATWGEPDLIDAWIYYLSDGYYK